MKRRDVMALIGAAAWPLCAMAQPRVHRIGALVIASPFRRPFSCAPTRWSN